LKFGELREERIGWALASRSSVVAFGEAEEAQEFCSVVGRFAEALFRG